MYLGPQQLKKIKYYRLFLSRLPPEAAETQLKKYGAVLMENAAQPTAAFIKELCSSNNNSHQTHPEDFIKLFINSPEAMIDFLEHCVAHRSADLLETDPVKVIILLVHNKDCSVLEVSDFDI